MTQKDTPEETPSPEEEIVPSSKEKELEKAIEALKDQHLRALADLDNFRKRAEREREDIAKFAIADFARDLLPVVDNLRRALESVPEEHAHPEKLLKSLLEGVEITEKELLFALKKHGVEKIDPLGQAFDHQWHQAMFEVEEGDHPPGTIVRVLQPGYQLNNRLLRSALVGVAKGKSSPPHCNPEGDILNKN